MDQSPEHIVYLWKQFASKQASGEELDEFFAYISKAEDHEFSNAFFDQYFASQVTGEMRGQEYWLNKLERIMKAAEVREEMISETTADLNSAANTLPSTSYLHPRVGRIHFLKRTWFRYAAIIILVVLSTVFFFKEYTVDKESSVLHDKAPGSDKAVLILADGRQISLDTLTRGKLASQGNNDILVLETGKIQYVDNGKNGHESGFNIIKTPKGGQFKLQLPDGSKVWINAASSITYPTQFTGDERRVVITGEVYFEVAQQASIPFIVETNKTYVEVLGTSFNINAYENEAFSQTTLINGKIKVGAGKRSLSNPRGPFVILQPGQQAKVYHHGNESEVEMVKEVNTDQITAWKEGIFNFDKLDLISLMKQLERWYDIEVQYEGKVKNITFRGKVYRNVHLSDVLDVLQKMGVSFEQKGNKLIIKSID